MSSRPIFADPSTTIVYQPVPPARRRPSSVSGGQPPHLPPPTMEMVVVQNAPQPPAIYDSLSNMPLPPGMEIVLGDKKFTIQYQSYEMTREKATEYVAKCTGTPYPRMSSPPPPDPQPIPRPPSVVGGRRANSREGYGGSATMASAGDRFQRTSYAVVAPPIGGTPVAILGDRGTLPTSLPPPATSEEQQQRLKAPDEVYTTMAPAAITRGLLSQSQPPLQTYAPPPPPLGGPEQPQQQALGYFWEDGVWKVWQANVGEATAKMPPHPSVPIQHSQNPPQLFTSQREPERPQYQYHYQYSPQLPPAPEPAPYALPPSQEQLYPTPARGAPPQLGNQSGSSTPVPTNTDPMLSRYI